MKFYQQFEIDKLFEPNSESMSHVTSVLEPENHAENLV